jgi:DivIVA domain-containing protein
MTADAYGSALLEPYVPGSGKKVPAQIRHVLWGYPGMALGAFVGGFVALASFLPDNPGWEDWFDGGLIITWLGLWGWAVALLVQHIRFRWLLRRPRQGCSATVMAYHRDRRTLTLTAPAAGHLPELKVRLAWWTKAGMLLPGENVTCYGQPFGIGPLLVSSAQRNMAFLGTGTRRENPPSSVRVPQHPLISAPDPDINDVILARWVEAKKFTTTRLRPGYDQEEVDAFLDAIRDTFIGTREPPLTTADIRGKQFTTTRLRAGYDEEEVDAFLNEAESRLAALVSAGGEVSAAHKSPDTEAGALRTACLECGADRTEDTQLCARCGAPIAQQPSGVTGGPVESIGPPAVPYGAPGQQDGYSRLDVLVIAAMGFVVLLAVIVWAVARSSPTTPSAAPTPSVAPTPLTINQLRPGDCLTGSDLGGAIAVAVPGFSTSWPDPFSAVPCTQDHIAEVFFAGDAWSQSQTYPGDDGVQSQADARCSSAFKAYDGVDLSQSEWSYAYSNPDSSTWPRGDRSLICIAYESGTEVVTTVDYSIKGSNK